jgi:hypothetical protein
MSALTCDRQPVAPARHRSTPQDLNASAPTKRDEADFGPVCSSFIN